MSALSERRIDGGTSLASLKILEEHARLNRPMPLSDIKIREGKKHQYMDRQKIKTMEQVFQPRTFEGQIGERHGLLQDLIDAINRGGVEDLGPAMVWWSGAEWFVVDGHHRLIAVDRWNAYQTKKGRTHKIKEVTVSVISGPLSKALEWTTRDNGKTHLTLTAKQRSDWAWRTGVMHWAGIIEGDFVIAQRFKTLHVSERTLRNMRAVWNKIKRGIEEQTDKQVSTTEAMRLAELSWRNAERLSRGEDEEAVWDDEERLKQVRAISEKLVRVFGKQAFSTPKAALIADALVYTSERFAALSLGSEDFEAGIRKAMKLTDPMDDDLDDPLYDDLDDGPMDEPTNY
ncbi:MAG: hypothetical protein P8N68_12015 [Paracoccaceae bacterium]|nr:hypothetical protein [Paracoccaceae bacterium]